MPRFNQKSLSYPEQDMLFETFCDMIHACESSREVNDLFKDLFNRQERMMFIRRVLIARALLQEKTYTNISTELGTSHTTISKVEQRLHFGREGLLRILRRVAKNI